MNQADIAQLARPSVLAAMAINQELRRREKARAYTSLVMDPKHKLNVLMDPTPRYIILHGGRGSAKSWGVAEALVRRADDPGEVQRLQGPHRILCTREYQNSIKDSVHQLLKDTVDRMGLDHRFYITDKAIRNTVTGSSFLFKGLHGNVQEIKSTEGITIAWNEEAQGTTNDSWQILIPTIRREGSQIIASMNVQDETDPTYDRFVNETNRPPDAVVHQLNYDENPYFPEVLRREMEYLKKVDFEAYQHVWLGQPKKISDAVIFGGRYRIEGFSGLLWKKAQRLFFGLDHGFARDPYALTRSFIVDRKLYIEYEAFGVGVEFAGNMADSLTPGGERRGELEQLLDSVPLSREWPIKADNSRPETISFLRGKGFNIEPADKWKGSVEDGIAHIKGFEEIIIHDRCKHMQQEARLYSFKKDKLTGEVLPIIVDKHNHGWDSIRYGLDGYIQRRGDLGLWARLAK